MIRANQLIKVVQIYSLNAKAYYAENCLGFKAVKLAKNHSLDYGPKVLMNTIPIYENS